MTYALRLIISVVILGMATAAGAQTSFQVVDPGGSIGTEVHGINNLGVFVGNYFTRSSSPTTSPQHAFHGFGSQIVNDDVLGALNSLAQGISNPSANGTIRGVGLFQDSGFQTHGELVVVGPTGGFQTRIVDVPNSIFTSANAVNANGWIVGKTAFGANEALGFLAVPPYGSGNFSTFVVPVPSDGRTVFFTEPLGIRDDNACVGVFTYTLLPGFVSGCANPQQVNGAGFAVIPPPPPATTSAFITYRLQPGTTLSSIRGGKFVGTVTADGCVTAFTGIANNGVVVGFFSGTDGADHGLIYFPAGAAAFGFVGPTGGAFAAIDAPNSFFTDIFGISPNATTIVGSFGSPSDLRTHGFIAR